MCTSCRVCWSYPVDSTFKEMKNCYARMVVRKSVTRRVRASAANVLATTVVARPPDGFDHALYIAGNGASCSSRPVRGRHLVMPFDKV